MVEEMNFTVIIATCGRPEELAVTLNAIARPAGVSGLPDRVIVADNAPDYSAAEAVRAFAATTPVAVTYLKTPPFDKTKALNAAIATAATDWLAFTDDDTLPDPAWLAEAGRFATVSGYRVFGGRIQPGPIRQPLPVWMQAGRSGRLPPDCLFVRYQPMPASGALTGDMPVPYGANVFVRKQVFAEQGGYDEALWALCGRHAIGVEDAEFGLRLRQRGEAIGYCHEALVVHPVHHARGTFRTHIRRSYDYGWREPLVFFDPARPWLAPYQARIILTRLWGMVSDAFRGDRAGAMDHLMMGMRCAGGMACRWSSAYRQRRRLACTRPGRS